MKKVFSFCAGVLISTFSIGLTACHNSDEQGQKINENEIIAVEVSDGIADFFEENVRDIAQSIFAEEGRLYSGCVMINGIEELPTVEVEGALLQYPVIDFDSHTLVIAQWIYGSSTLLSHSLVIDKGVPTLNMIMGKKGEHELENITQEIRTGYFWKIYPKIETDTILINVTKQ